MAASPRRGATKRMDTRFGRDRSCEQQFGGRIEALLAQLLA